MQPVTVTPMERAYSTVSLLPSFCHTVLYALSIGVTVTDGKGVQHSVPPAKLLPHWDSVIALEQSVLSSVLGEVGMFRQLLDGVGHVANVAARREAGHGP